MTVQGKRKKVKPGSILMPVFMAITSVLCLLPLYAIFTASLGDGTELLRKGLTLSILFPSTDKISIDNYALLFGSEGLQFWIWFKNSLIITLAGTGISLLLSSMVGYGFGMYNFKFKNSLFIAVLILVMMPFTILILPLFKMFVSMGFINSYMGAILPTAVSPLAVFFFRQYVVTLPNDFLDAGRIDGCTEFGIFIRIMAPMMLPAYGAMAIWLSLLYWNDFLWANIVLSTNDKFTIQLGLRALITPYGTNYDMLFSASAMSVLPIVVLFLVFQRYFISGLTAGGIKA